jgi:hypothetical protein
LYFKLQQIVKKNASFRTNNFDNKTKNIQSNIFVNNDRGSLSDLVILSKNIVHDQARSISSNIKYLIEIEDSDDGQDPFVPC